MLYSNEKQGTNSFRGKVWRLPNSYWRACNYSGQQCTYKLYNEALRFSQKGKPLNEGVKSHPTPPDLEKVLKRHGLKITDKDAQYKAWVHWSKAGGRGGQTGDVLVAIQVADDLKGPVEWSASWEHSGREIDGHGAAGLERALKTFFKQANENVSEGLKRQQSRYRPELSKSEMESLVAKLKKQGYKASASGPNLKTDATDKAIEMAEGVVYILGEDG